MPRIMVLSTDTNHHRYFLNEIRAAGISIASVIFETSSVQAPFPTGPLYEDEQDLFERQRWVGKLDLAHFDIHEVPNVNLATGRIAALNPDIGVVFGSRRLTPELISCFPAGLINVHRGIAEEYRGLDSDLWAIYHGDWGNIGVTLHMVDAELDAGDIVFQKCMTLSANMRLSHVRAHTSEIAAMGMIDVLKQWQSGALSRRRQTTKGRYYSFMPIDIKRIVHRKFNLHCESLKI